LTANNNGYIAGIVPWIVIVRYYVGVGYSGEAKPLTFVYNIVLTSFVFLRSWH
jgi:hypothetical protein